VFLDLDGRSLRRGVARVTMAAPSSPRGARPAVTGLVACRPSDWSRISSMNLDQGVPAGLGSW